MVENFLSIEVYFDWIRYIYLERSGRDLSLLKQGKISFAPDFSSPSQFTGIINEILSCEKISPSKIFITIFREDVVTHLIDLPKMSKEEIDEVILGKVEDISLFADKDFEYIHSSYSLNEKRIRVIFSAVFKNNLNYFIEGVKLTKISLESLELTPLNLLGILYRLSENKQVEALVVLGERISCILVFFKKQCRFFYTANTGKSDFVLSEGNKINNLAFLDWVEELRRIFKSYIVGYKGKEEAISRVWFVWDKEGAQDLDQDLSRELGQEVRKIDINAIPGLTIKNGNEFNPIDIFSLASVISSGKKFKSEFSFDKFLTGEKFKRLLRQVVTASLIYLAVTGGILGNIAIGYRMKTKTVSARLNKINSQIVQVKAKVQSLRLERNDSLEIKNKLLEQISSVKILNSLYWSKVFGEVISCLPKDLSLTFFEILESGRIEIKGESFRIESMAELMRKMNKSSILKDVESNFLKEKESQGKKIFTFGIRADLKRGLNDKK